MSHSADAHRLNLPVGIGDGLNHSLNFFVFCHDGGHYTTYGMKLEGWRSCETFEMRMSQVESCAWCVCRHAHVGGAGLRKRRGVACACADARGSARISNRVEHAEHVENARSTRSTWLRN